MVIVVDCPTVDQSIRIAVVAKQIFEIFVSLYGDNRLGFILARGWCDYNWDLFRVGLQNDFSG